MNMKIKPLKLTELNDMPTRRENVIRFADNHIPFMASPFAHTKFLAFILE